MQMVRSINSTTIGKRVRSLREAQHESQEKLAQTLNVSREMVSKIESGGQFPSVVVLSELSFHFHVSTDYILFGAYQKPDVIQQLDQVITILKSIQRKL
jgi:transcriptional regulator with XRE-family HTH domain